MSILDIIIFLFFTGGVVVFGCSFTGLNTKCGMNDV